MSSSRPAEQGPKADIVTLTDEVRCGPRSRLIKWCAKAARQYDCDNVLSFLGVARDVSFPVRILDENSFSRRKASHLSIARFKFHVAIQPYGEESIRRRVKARFALGLGQKR